MLIRKCNYSHVTDVSSMIQMGVIDLNELPINLNDEQKSKNIYHLGTGQVWAIILTKKR